MEGISTDIVLNLRYGKGLTSIRMDAVSNATATPVRARNAAPGRPILVAHQPRVFFQDEYQRMVATFKADKAELPTPVQAKKRKEELQKHKSYQLTEVGSPLLASPTPHDLS